jgi:Family of unknown function (DUF6518)
MKRYRIPGSVVLGLLVGLLTSFGQKYLPEFLLQFANSYSVWLVASFFVGSLATSYKKAMMYGTFTQLSALLGYYVTSYICFGAQTSLFSAIFDVFFVGAIFAGPILGLAGYEYSRNRKYSLYAMAAFSGSFLSEGLYTLIQLKYSVGYAFLFIGLAIAVMLKRTERSIIQRLLSSMFFGLIFYGMLASVFMFADKLGSGTLFHPDVTP